jgi:hypothetical protein
MSQASLNDPLNGQGLEATLRSSASPGVCVRSCSEPLVTERDLQGLRAARAPDAEGRT